MDELTGRDKNKLDNFKKNKPIYDAIVEALNNAVSDKVYKNPETFTPVVIIFYPELFQIQKF
mgnify:CR=1 FL=1